jgi:sarcosine oxidase subunit gamma
MEPMHPVWTEVRGMAAVLRFAGPEQEDRLKGHLALADLSCLPRLGLKGAGVLPWLRENGLQTAEALYAVRPIEGHGILVRIDREEVFLEDGLRGQVVSRIQDRLSANPPGVYRVERQEASFLLIGPRTGEVLSQTCGHHFRESAGQVVLSRVAGVSCRLLRVEASGIAALRIWLDPSYSVYLWETLLGIVREDGGDAVGLGCLYPGLSPASSLKG